MAFKYFRALPALVIALPLTAKAQAVAPIPAKIVPLAFTSKISLGPASTSASNSAPPTTNTYNEFSQRKGIVCAPTPLKNSNNPLIILDGSVIPNWRLQNLNPDNIENILVIKGEKAISEYGRSGENGVLVITTKRTGVNKKGRLN